MGRKIELCNKHVQRSIMNIFSIAAIVVNAVSIILALITFILNGFSYYGLSYILSGLILIILIVSLNKRINKKERKLPI